MVATTYLDFDLLVEYSGEGRRARVLNPPAAQAVFDFRLPFSEFGLTNPGVSLEVARSGGS